MSQKTYKEELKELFKWIGVPTSLFDPYTANDIKSALKPIEDAGIRMDLNPEEVEAYKIADSYALILESLQLNGSGATTLFVPALIDEPVIVVAGKKPLTEIELLTHQLPKYEFYRNHKLAKQKAMSDKRSMRLKAEISKQGYSPLREIAIIGGVTALEVISNIDVEQNIKHLSDIFVAYVARKIDPEWKIPEDYAREIRDAVLYAERLSQDKVKRAIYSSHTVDEFSSEVTKNL